MINDYKFYINKICSVLKIKPPHISFDNSKFKSNTMLAMCETENNTIYLKETDILTPDHIFAIAHELRHLWQFQNNKELFLSNYESIDKIGLEKYNSQLDKVDAHAFAAILTNIVTAAAKQQAS